jgi:CHASE3 domain sensor protein
MPRHTTFSQKVAAGLGVTALLTVAVGAVAAVALRAVVASKDDVITVHAQRLVDTERLRVSIEKKGSNGRTYLLTGDESHLDKMRQARVDFLAGVDRLNRTADQQDARDLLAAIQTSEAAHQEALEEVYGMRSAGVPVATVAQAWEERASPKRAKMDAEITAFTAMIDRDLRAARESSTGTANRAVTIVIVLAAAAACLAGVVAYLLARTLSRQIGTAVGQVQTSSAELEAVASQQATGAKEEATAMSEITTTINELLATSRQCWRRRGRSPAARSGWPRSRRTRRARRVPVTPRSSRRTRRSPPSVARWT